MKITKKYLEFELEIYKEQRNGKVYHLFLTQSLHIRQKVLYCKLLKEIFVIHIKTPPRLFLDG